MKKLIAMIAAAVMGFAYGDGLKNTVGFEDLDANTVLDTTKDDAGADIGSKFWYAGAEELGTVTAYNSDAYNYGSQPVLVTDGPGSNFLALDSGSTVLYRTITANDGTGLPTATDIDEGLFFDSLVKFTVTEYDPTAAVTVDEGTKLAVWLGQAESDEGDAPTNLIVTAAIWNPDAGDAGEYVATNFEATVTGVNLLDGAWHRVTARAIKNVASDYVAGFTLFIDTVPVTYSINPFAGGAQLTPEANILLGKGALFLNIMSGNDACTELQGFGFKGTGSIDDVAITDKANAPLFAKGQKQLTVSWDANVDSITINDNALDLTGKESDVVMLDEMTGNTIAVTYKTGFVKGAWEFDGATVDGTTLTLLNEVASIDIASAAEMFQVGANKYGTFAEALAAAGAEGTISLVDDYAAGANMNVIGDTANSVTADIVLDLAGNDFIAEALADEMLFYVDEGSTLKVIDSIGGGKMAATYAGESEFSGLFYGDTFIGDDEGDEGATFDSLIGYIGENGVIVKGWFSKDNEQTALEDLIPETGYAVTEDGDYWKVSAADAPVVETFSVTAAPAAENSTLTVQTNGVDLVGEENVYTANQGDTIVVTYTADEGFEFDGEETVTQSFTEDDDTTFAEAPVPTAAALFKGAGTEADPFQIWTEADLNKLATLINDTKTAPDFNTAYYKQMDDITMAEAFTGIGNISKQGTAADCFKGYYDGNGKEISNLIIAKRSDSNRYRGLFNSAAGGAVISNLTVTITGMASDAETGEFGGGLIGFSGTSSSTIVDTTVVGCTVKGAINAAGNVGGLASRAYGTMFVKDTVVDLDITVIPNSYNGKTGGFIGHEQNAGAYGKVFENCQFTGSITVQAGGTVAGVGAFVGNGTPKSITGCSTVGAVFTFADGTRSDFGQLFGTGVPSAVDGTITVNADALALGSSKAFDGLNFATVDAGVATLISTNAFVKGNTYKVMAGGVAGEVFALAAEGDTIAFDLSLVNDAYNFTVGAAAGLKAEAGAVTEHVVTFTAMKDGPTDWPTDPEDPLVKGKTADEAFPGKVPTALANVPAANFSAWAKKAGISFAEPGVINIDAYLLDCAVADLETEKAKFVITSIAFDGEKWVVTVANEFGDKQPYNANATVEIVDITDEFDEALTEKSDAKGFFKAELKAITLTK